jgi:glyceraldehyde 3-phosphate dehydrogenase
MPLWKICIGSELVEQIKYSTNNELVSSDIVGTSAPSIYDSNATIVSNDGKNIVLYIWYDNELRTSQIRLAYIAKVRRFTLLDYSYRFGSPFQFLVQVF